MAVDPPVDAAGMYGRVVEERRALKWGTGRAIDPPRASELRTVLAIAR